MGQIEKNHVLDRGVVSKSQLIIRTSRKIAPWVERYVS